MSNTYTLKISKEEAKEMPMVDLAFNILKAANTPYYYRDLMNEIAKIKGISDDEVMEVIAHLYTEINIDGRFACVGTNLWGLKRWYPIEKAEDPLGNAQRPRIINDEDEDDDEDEDPFDGEEDDDFDEEDLDDEDEVFDDEDADDDEDELSDDDIDELDEEIDDDEDVDEMDLEEPLPEDDDDEDEEDLD